MIELASGNTPMAKADQIQAAPDLAALHAAIGEACSQACRAIAPAWPLDRAIAVNPHWSRIHLPVRRVAARMAVLFNRWGADHDLLDQLDAATADTALLVLSTKGSTP